MLRVVLLLACGLQLCQEATCWRGSGGNDYPESPFFGKAILYGSLETFGLVSLWYHGLFD